jgi:hypothetical protein
MRRVRAPSLYFMSVPFACGGNSQASSAAVVGLERHYLVAEAHMRKMSPLNSTIGSWLDGKKVTIKSHGGCYGKTLVGVYLNWARVWSI